MLSRKNELLLAAGDMAATFQSDPVDVRNIVVGSVQIVMTGAPVGTFTLQASNDTFQFLKQPGIEPTPTNWTDVENSSTAISAAGTVMYNLTSIGYDLLRVVYTRTSGTGACQIRVVAKG